MSEIQQLDDLLAMHSAHLKELEEEVARVKSIVHALQTAHDLIHANTRQTRIAETEPYSELKPDDLVLAIVNSNPKSWTVREIIDAAKRGGKNVDQWKQPYNFLYNYCERLRKAGKIRVIRENPKAYGRVM